MTSWAQSRVFSVALLVPVSLLVSCSRPAVPVPLGQAVPFGDGQLTISGVEMRSTRKGMELAVFFQWTGATKVLLRGVFSGPKLKMQVSDSAGRVYQPYRPDWSVIAPMPEASYRLFSSQALYEPHSRDGYEAMAEDAVRYHRESEEMLADAEAGRNPIRWVHLFAVEPDSGGFTLLASNPDTDLSQPAAITVDLRR